MADSSPAPEKVAGHINDLLRGTSDLELSVGLERNKNKDSEMGIVCNEVSDVTMASPVMNLKTRRTLKGHRGKILHFDWSPDKRHLVTAGQDGFAVVWNGFTAQKEVLVQTTSPWVLSCAYSPSTTLLACGGVENQCSIYNIEKQMSEERSQAARVSLPNKILGQHSKYISYCTFFGSDQQLLTASADCTCALWDMEKTDPVQKFVGHKAEVFGLSLNPRDPYKVFASGCSDGSTHIWDVRSGKREMKFTCDDSVNAVKFFPSGEAVAVAGNDGTVHLYDLRADQKLKSFSKPSIVFGASSVDFSKSGRIMFVGYNDHSVRAWDVLKDTHLIVWLHHQDRVSNVMLSPDGMCLGTSSWDGSMKLLA